MAPHHHARCSHHVHPSHAALTACAACAAASLLAACAGAPPPAAAASGDPQGPSGAHHHHAEHGAPGDAHHEHGAGGHHRFDDAARWATVFDAPDRDAWQRPDDVLRALALAPDARVADVGAGTGYFSVRLARAAPQGRVWASDIEPAMVRFVRERAAREHLGNVFSVLATTDDPMIPEPVDVILVVDTNHHIEDRVRYYGNLRGMLRPHGRVVIVDYQPDAPEGPPPAMRLSITQVDAEMRSAGYAREGAPLLLPRQYVLSYSPAPAPAAP